MRRWRLLILCGLAGLVALVAASTACKQEKPAPASEKTKSASNPIHYTIRGRIALEGGDDPTGTTVYCAGTSYAAYCDNAGGYMISNVPYGRYMVVAQKPGYERTELGETILLPVAAGAASSEVEIPLVELPRDEKYLTAQKPEATGTGTIVGRAVVDDGDTTGAIQASLSGTQWEVQTDGDGIFTLSGVDPGAYDLVLDRAGYESQTRRVLVRAGQVSRLARLVELRSLVPVVEGKGTILGEVLFLGAGGQVADPVEGATVGIVENDRTTPVKKDGSFVFDNLDPGLYTLIADAAGFQLRNKVQVRVTQDPATAIMFLQETPGVGEERGGVEGRIQLADSPETPLAGIVVALTGSSHMGVTDTSGAFRLTDVPAGTYSLFCSRQGFETLQLTGINIEAGRVEDLGVLEMSRSVDPPRVIFASPGDGTDGITIEPTVRLRLGFSRRMDSRSVQDALRISPAVTWEMRRVASGSDAPDAVEILLQSAGTPSPLKFNTRYTLTLGRSATDTDGTALEDTFRLRFSTGGLRILEVRPASGTTNVNAAGPTELQVYFNGVVDTMPERSLDISPSPQARSNTIDFRPVNATGWTLMRLPITWAYDTQYTVTFRSGIRTVGGVRFDQSPYRVRFRTAPIPQFGQ